MSQSSKGYSDPSASPLRHTLWLTVMLPNMYNDYINP